MFNKILYTLEGIPVASTGPDYPICPLAIGCRDCFSFAYPRPGLILPLTIFETSRGEPKQFS